MAIPGRRRDNGLYLCAFDDKQEAIDYVKDLANKYRYTPKVLGKRTSIRKLCREAEEDGVDINRQSLSSWFKELNVKVEDRRPRQSNHTNKTFSFADSTIEALEGYDNQSYIVDLGVRLVTRQPMQDIIVFFPQEDDEEPINVIFREIEKGQVQAIATGKLNKRDKKQIRSLIKKSEQNGIEVIKDYAEIFGYRWYGGNSLS